MTNRADTRYLRVTLRDNAGVEVETFEADLQPGDDENSPYTYDGRRTGITLSNLRQGVADFVQAMAADGLEGSVTIEVERERNA